MSSLHVSKFYRFRYLRSMSFIIRNVTLKGACSRGGRNYSLAFFIPLSSVLIILRPAHGIRCQVKLWACLPATLPYLPSLHTAFRFLFLNTAITKLSSLLKHGANLPDGPQNRRPRSLLGSSRVFSLLALTSPSLLASQQNRVFNILVALFAST